MTYFLDASALVKRYFAEPGSDKVRALLRRRPRLLISRMSKVEVAAALWRRARAGDIPRATARAVLDTFTADLATMTVVEPRGVTLDLAADLVERHALRAYDAVQLASALRWARETGLALSFVCSDHALAKAAATESLRTMTPV